MDSKHLNPLHNRKVQTNPETHAERSLQAKIMITGFWKYRQAWQECEVGGQVVGKGGGV